MAPIRLKASPATSTTAKVPDAVRTSGRSDITMFKEYRRQMSAGRATRGTGHILIFLLTQPLILVGIFFVKRRMPQ